MVRTNRWLNVVALTFVLVTVWASPLWAPYHRFDYSQWDRVSNLNTKVIELMKKGKYQEAVEPAEKVLRLTKQIYLDDPDNDNVEVMRQNLAFIYMGLGRYDEAEPLFKQILETDEALVGPNDPEVARSLNNLAELYRTQGKYAEAEPLQKRALGIQEKVLGPGHPSVARTMYDLALVYMEQGKYSEAEPLYKRTLAIEEKALGPDHTDVAWTLRKLAELYNKMGRDDEAESMRKRALVTFEKALGPDHLTVAALRLGKAATPFNKGVDYAKKGQYDSAIAAYKEAIRLKPDYAMAHNRLGWA